MHTTKVIREKKIMCEIIKQQQFIINNKVYYCCYWNAAQSACGMCVFGENCQHCTLTTKVGEKNSWR